MTGGGRRPRWGPRVALAVVGSLALQRKSLAIRREIGDRRGEVTSLLQITFFQDEFLGLVDSHGLEELLEKHGEILKADLALKTSGGMEAAILEGLVARLSSKMVSA